MGAAANPQPRLRLHVTASAESAIRAGHPWLYDGGVRHQNRPGKSGELAIIYDRDDEFLAVGLFDPGSALRVRILHSGSPTTINSAWWNQRLEASLARREGLLGVDTNGYRLIHGENDGWPGLVLDRYATAFVLKLYAASWLPRLPELTALLRQNLSSLCQGKEASRLIVRFSRNIQIAARSEHRIEDGALLWGDETSDIQLFQESGLTFEAAVRHGQKTGFFLDQRENRRAVGELARGRDVLNGFSFTGGFSVYAARGEASSVTDVDISEHALAGARRNFEHNKGDAAVASCHHTTIQADVFAWLSQTRHAAFDLIVLDPPSLARREAERGGAIRAYGRMVSAALRLLRSGGILVAASCSAHVSAEEFFGVVREAARSSKRRFVERETREHPADHPATFAEARYLKAIYLDF